MIIKYSIIFTLFISLCSSSVTRDKIIIEESAFLPIAPHNEIIIGTSRVHLDGKCKNVECNLGNFIADAIVDWNALQYNNTNGWTDAAIALVEGGAIKSSIEKSESGLTQEIIESALEGSKIVIIEITGAILKDALEHAVNRYEKDKEFDEFLQFSGLNVAYDMRNSTGDRVVSVEVLCAECVVPQLDKLDATKTYKILMQESLANGSNGYEMFKDKTVKTINTLDTEMFAEFLKKKSPIYPAVEWRITVQNGAYAVKISLILILSTLIISVFK